MAANRWVTGARPRTLPAALAPVMVGTGVSGGGGSFVLSRTALALVVALGLQVGVNYANDYQDGVRGADRDRTGPRRLVAAGLATPAEVRRAAAISFAVACAAGLALAVMVQPWLLLVGVAAVAAAWGYTGGPRPYGYAGFGELSVFVFFGVVAVVGSAYVQQGRLSWLALAASVPVGLSATALLVVNNLRDRDADARAGKRTLAVRIGETATRNVYLGCLAGAPLSGAALAAARPWCLLAIAALPFVATPARRVAQGACGRELVVALGETARLQLVLAALLTAGLWAG